MVAGLLCAQKDAREVNIGDSQKGSLLPGVPSLPSWVVNEQRPTLGCREIAGCATIDERMIAAERWQSG